MKITEFEKQKEFLEKHLQDINTIVSAKLGVKTKFKIVTSKDYRGVEYLYLADEINRKSQCGIMQVMLAEVILTSTVYWNDNNTTIVFDFKYEHIPFGSNGHEFCRIGIDYDAEVLKLY